MLFSFSRSILAIVFIAGTVLFAHAQGDATTRGGEQPTKEDYPTGVRESLAKQRIDRDKKDFAELLARGEEAAKISTELEKSFTQSNQLSTDDKKKLDRLEKLVKKIRNELGADNDDDEAVELTSKPLSIGNALKALQDNTVKLVGELKKNTRYSVSVIAVESSNALLKVVRFLRGGKN